MHHHHHHVRRTGRAERRRSERDNNNARRSTIRTAGMVGPPSSAFTVEVVKSGVVLETIALGSPRTHVTFGRHPDATSSSNIRRVRDALRVVQFKKDSNDVFAFDPGSTHGTFVNKRRLKKRMHAPIFVGDQIKFGESTRDYVIGGDETLMPEVGLTKRELEKAKEMQRRKTRRRRKKWKTKNGRSGGGLGNGIGGVREEEECPR